MPLRGHRRFPPLRMERAFSPSICFSGSLPGALPAGWYEVAPLALAEGVNGANQNIEHRTPNAFGAGVNAEHRMEDRDRHLTPAQWLPKPATRWLPAWAMRSAQCGPRSRRRG